MTKYKVEHDGRSWAVFKQERLPGPTPFMTWKLLNCFNASRFTVGGKTFEAELFKIGPTFQTRRWKWNSIGFWIVFMRPIKQGD